MNEIEKAQLAKTTIQCFTGLVGDLSSFPGLLRKVIEVKAWECRLHNGRLYELPSLRDLVTRKPPEGWGQNPDKIEALLKDSPEVLACWREEMKGKPGRKEKGCDSQPIQTAKGTGNKAYTLDRLKRENAELFQQVVAGELSANAAAVKAGWRKKKMVIAMEDDATLTARNILAKMGREWVKALQTALDEAGRATK
jgi:hypothetical protein